MKVKQIIFATKLEALVEAVGLCHDESYTSSVGERAYP